MAKFSRTFLIFWTNTKLLTNIWLQIQKSKIVAYKYSSLNHHWENITVNFFLLKRMNFIILLTFINYYKVLLLLYKGPLAKAFFGWSFIRHFFVSSTNRIFFWINKSKQTWKSDAKEEKKSPKTFKNLQISKKFWKEEMLYSKFWYFRAYVFDQQSSVHAVSKSRGGNLNNIDWQTSIYSPKYLCIIWD